MQEHEEHDDEHFDEHEEENVFIDHFEDSTWADDSLMQFAEDDSYNVEEEDDFAEEDHEALEVVAQSDAADAEYLLTNEHEMVQLEDDGIDHSSEWYQANEIGMAPLGVEYVRNLPEIYNEETQNKFMRIILTQFALEGKTADGKPNGVFKMDQKHTREAGKMIVEKYKKLEGPKAEDYMK